MGTYNGALRRARAEVAPHVPYLATKLTAEPHAITNAVIASLGRQGFAPRRVSEADINKASRHAISAWAINRQRAHLVSGSGREARFRPEMVRYSTELWPDLSRDGKSRLFKLALARILNLGATRVQEEYTDGADPVRQVWPILSQTYGELGKQAMELTKDAPWSVPLEGSSLYEAVRSHALEETAEGHAFFVKRHVAGETGELLEAAHDLSYLPKAVSAHHIVGSMAMFGWWRSLRGEVVQNDAGTYVFAPSDRGKFAAFWHNVDGSHVVDAALKCPAREAGTLDDYIHASINSMPEFGML